MIKAVDFFCGCGGTSAGLRRAGIKILAGIDFDPDAGKTFKINFPEAKFFLEDIRNLHPFNLRSVIDSNRDTPLLFSACAPCQPFSKQKTSKRKKDDRVELLDEFHRFVSAFRPDYIFLENVPGLQKIKSEDGPLNRFIGLIDRLGYSFDVKTPGSHDYGVPQVRRRLVLVASLLGDLSLPSATHGPSAPNPEYETVWNWIGDLPPIGAGEEHPAVNSHRAAALSEQNLMRIRATPEGGGRMDWPDEFKLKCHRNHTGHTDVYGRLHKDKPSAALSTRCVSLSNGRYGHPTQDRAISVREAARLQTFDDEFIFFGNLNSMARQIGNAVPVRLAEVFGRHFCDHYRNTPFYSQGC